MRIFVLFSLAILSASTAFAGDTIVVRTLTFDDITKRSGTWLFPPPQRYEKVLMEYTLKCDPRTTQDRFDCGEWDYLSYTFLRDSTGKFDSTRREAVNFRVRGVTPDSFLYRMSSVPGERRRVTTTTVDRKGRPMGTLVDVGGSTFGEHPGLLNSHTTNRFVWTAAELRSSGVSAGPISGMAFSKSGEATAELTLLTVRIGTSTAALPEWLASDGLATVVRRPATLRQGINHLPFSKPFTWDGTSDLVIELSAEGMTEELTLHASDESPALVGRLSQGQYAWAFTQGDRMELPASVGASIDEQCTIAFWAFGDADRLPRASSVLEAYDDAGRRVLNVHLPWENGSVYWDAGRDAVNGEFDRIELAAPVTATEGRWNHWAFVKNARSGIMRIYLNGALFHEGNGKQRPMTGISTFHLGAGSTGSYEGYLDEIAIWKTAVDSATIASWVHRRVDENHPANQHLVALYRADATDPHRPAIATDLSRAGVPAMLTGPPNRRNLLGQERGHMTAPTTLRPYVTLEMGAVGADTTVRTVDLPIDLPRTHLFMYENRVQPRIYRHDAPNHPLLATDTLPIYAAGRYPVKDERGVVVDSVTVEAERTIRRVVSPWFDPVVDFEIGRYITPYGIGLDLGPNGFKWVFDVTDYAPLFRDNVTLSAGNQQELIDLRFVFVKGTPPRDVVQIDQVYSQRDGSYADMAADRLLTPTELALHREASTWRLKTRTTGHRFGEPSNCAEFCQRLHNVSVDGTKRFEWLLWNECGNNPVYPQGGTWQLDRAGWCPGAPVDVYDWELTPWVGNDGRVTVDYGVQGDQWNGSQGVWDVTMQLFGYGAINHTVDAGIVDIIAPSTWEFHRRVNPVCGDPIVVLRNGGSERLTQVTFTYGIDGEQPRTYRWTGALDFMAMDTVVLPGMDWTRLEGDQRFTVTVSRPNGRTDEYAGNDTRHSDVTLPPVFYRDLTINLLTNRQAAAQYAWVLRRIGGEVVAQGANLADMTAYKYDYRLEDGCYEFVLLNKEGYGLDLWFIRDQLGTGSLTMLSRGTVQKAFNPDFGTTAWLQFRVQAKPSVAVDRDTLDVGTTMVGDSLFGRVAITPEDEAGLIVRSVSVSSLRNVFRIRALSRDTTGGLTLAYGDTLFVDIGFSRSTDGRSVGSLRIETNDERTQQKLVRLVGTAADPTSVTAGTAAAAAVVDAGVVPNPSTGVADAVVHVFDRVPQGRITVVDLVGRTVTTVHEGTLDPGTLRLPLPTTLPSGSYLLAVETPSGIYHTPFTIVR